MLQRNHPMRQFVNDNTDDFDSSFTIHKLTVNIEGDQSDDSTVDFVGYNASTESQLNLSAIQSLSDDNSVDLDDINGQSFSAFQNSLRSEFDIVEEKCVTSLKVKACLLRNMSENERDVKKLFMDWKVKQKGDNLHTNLPKQHEAMDLQTSDQAQTTGCRIEYDNKEALHHAPTTPCSPKGKKKVYKLKANDLNLSAEKKKEIENLFWLWKRKVIDRSPTYETKVKLSKDRRWIDEDTSPKMNRPRPACRKRSSSLEMFARNSQCIDTHEDMVDTKDTHETTNSIENNDPVHSIPYISIEPIERDTNSDEQSIDFIQKGLKRISSVRHSFPSVEKLVKNEDTSRYTPHHSEISHKTSGPNMCISSLNTVRLSLDDIRREKYNLFNNRQTEHNPLHSTNVKELSPPKAPARSISIQQILSEAMDANFAISHT